MTTGKFIQLRTLQDCDAIIAKLRADNERLRAALEFVEWRAVHPGYLEKRCPWCQGEKPNHEPFCQRQKALGLAEADNDTPE